MGATRWQSIYKTILPAARDGLLVAVILGMGRAIGETMAVQMVIGNATQFNWNPFKPSSTLTSQMVTNMGEATGDFRSALFSMALVLLILAILLIVIIRWVSRQRGMVTR
jgi:ABC-type phosphate transport system permease subunit